MKASCRESRKKREVSQGIFNSLLLFEFEKQAASQTAPVLYYIY